MKMKRLASVLLSVLLLVTLSACSQGAKLSRGTWDGKTFTNEFSGITLTVPDSEDWTIASEEDLAALMDIAEDTMEDANKFQAALAKIQSVQDMMVQNTATNSSAIVMYENLALHGVKSDYTAEDFAKEVVTGLKENNQIPYTISDTYTTTVCGKEYVVVPAEVVDYGMNQSYLMRREGNYMVEIILTGVGQEAIDELLQMFAA